MIGPILHKSLLYKKNDTLLIHEIPLIYITGLIINYSITLLFKPLHISLILSGIFSTIGLVCYALYLFKSYRGHHIIWPSLCQWMGVLVVCTLFLGPIITEPLKDWDARSIWFFHGKMIYEAETICREAGWQHPSVAVTHPDYPKLIPALSAQSAYIIGFWNEYFPKISLLFILIPAIILIFSFAERSYSFVFLLLLIPFSFYRWLWNGYMDGYFAMFLSLAMLLFGRYLIRLTFIDLAASISCLTVLLYLKNEGLLAVLSGMITIILFALLSNNIKTVNILQGLSRRKWSYGTATLTAIFPLLIWSFYKRLWGLESDLQIFSLGAITRILTRLHDGSYLLIMQSMYEQLKIPVMLLGLIYFASIARKISLSKNHLSPLVTGGIYCLGIFVVYLLTPQDLSWHLQYSIDRTMLPITGCIYVTCYMIFKKIECSFSGQQ